MKNIYKLEQDFIKVKEIIFKNSGIMYLVVYIYVKRELK